LKGKVGIFFIDAPALKLVQ